MPTKSQTLANQALAIIDRIEASGRPSTAAEQLEIKNLVNQAKAAKADDELRDLVNGLSGGYRGPGAPHAAAGWADEVTKAAAGPNGEFKALLVGSATVPSLLTTIIPIADRPTSLLQALNATVNIGTDTFGYLRESTRTHNAAPVAPGAAKPTSTYTVTRVDDRVRTIAHLSEAINRQTLADVGMLRDYVQTSLYGGVMLALENQVIGGSGVGENLLGIANTPSIQVQAKGADPGFTAIRKAMTKLQLVSLSAGLIVMHPNNWETLEVSQTTTGAYMTNNPGVPNPGPPIDSLKRTLWGVPVAVTIAATAGTGYVMDLDSLQLWEREHVIIDWSENTIDVGTGKSIFELNQIKFRAEGRWGFGVTRPSGICQVTGLT